MRLINTSTLQFEQFSGIKKPPYAILSHTWGNGEVSYDEALSPTPETRQKAGYQKIATCCRKVEEIGLSYAWIDTCCIDKRSSAELSEAINSMYRWYRDAEVCFAYIVDFDSVNAGGGMSNSEEKFQMFRNSRWFSRGWTLQELIAPRVRLFFSKDWELIDLDGDAGRKGLLDEFLPSISGISQDVLQHRKPLPKLCVAERISWVSKRQTTREEDMAYCLMGILNIDMPILYGEGLQKAFRRLQEEFMKNSFDYSLFAWNSSRAESGLLANSPADFANMPQLGLWNPVMLSPFQMTNLGLLIKLNVNDREQKNPHFTRAALQVDVRTPRGWGIFVIRLKPVKHLWYHVNGKRYLAYRRVGCATFEAASSATLIGTPYLDVLVLEDEHLDFVQTAQEHHDRRWDSGTDLMLVEDLYSED